MNLQQRIAARAVAHIPPGAVVNLGIGIPTYVADHLPLDSVALQTENGLLGVGPTPGPARPTRTWCTPASSRSPRDPGRRTSPAPRRSG